MEAFFKQGLMHPLLTTSHMMLGIGLGILLGQQGKAHFLKNCFLFFAVIILSALMVKTISFPWEIAIISMVVAAIIGILVAIKLNLSQWIVLFLTLFAAMMVGQESAPVMIPGLKASTINAFVFGAAITSTAVLFLTAMIAVLFKNLGSGIVLRVLGSWVVAAAMMVGILLTV